LNEPPTMILKQTISRETESGDKLAAGFDQL